ncbi:hypothetical protein FQN54_008444 [Arachnomyces sp. PD_36]|nr:hypothetical protein FQN54_008444 [Arachnomyces sp. PD_36]
MRSFLSFPVELHHIILDFVEPGDIPSLYLSCKHFQNLANDRLKEHKFLTELLQKRRGTGQLLTPRDPLNGPKNDVPAMRLLLLDIQEDPRFAWYIQEPLWSRPQDPEDLLKDTSDRSVVHKSIRTSRFISDGEREGWYLSAEDIESGVVLALLLSQLPRLRNLCLELKPYDSTLIYVARIVSRVAARSYQGFLDQPLSVLETVDVKLAVWNLTWDMDYMGKVLRLLVALTTLPNLKYLSLHDYSTPSFIHSKSENYSDWMRDLNSIDSCCPLSHTPSQLRSLEFNDSCISASSLSVILRNCATLEHFKYRIEDMGEVFGWKPSRQTAQAPSPDYIISAICETLLAHAGSSLKSLHLDVGGWNPISFSSPRWNFDQFTTLERLTIDSDIFSEQPDSWPLFADILPVSLEAIYIIAKDYPEDVDPPMIPTMLQNFRPQSFPHLHTFTIWRYFQDPNGRCSASHIIPNIKSMLSDAGVPQSEVHEYNIEYKVFPDHRIKHAPPRYAYDDCKIGWEPYGFSSDDTAGHLVMGLYHSEGRDLPALNRGQENHYFSGVRVMKSWQNR